VGDDHGVVVAGGARPPRLCGEVGVARETGARVVGRQVDGDRAGARGLEALDDRVPVPGLAAGAGDEQEGGHVPG
jgi:hypothetical protein